MIGKRPVNCVVHVVAIACVSLRNKVKVGDFGGMTE
jgi:hypothetical protein